MRVRGLESDLKVDGKGGMTLALDLLKDESTSIAGVEYFVNSVKIQSATGPDAVAWKPPGSGTFEFTAKVTLADGSVVQSRVVPVIVAGLATRPVNANYSGAVVDASGAKSAATTGQVTFSTTSYGSLGSYTMRLVLNGARFGAAGRFGAESVGTATLAANLPALGKTTLRLFFQQEATGLADTIRGVVTDGSLNASGEPSGGSFVSNFVANRNVWMRSIKETGDMSAKYTVTLPSLDERAGGTPGVGVVSLSNLGVVFGLFTMGDGIRSSQSGWISTGGIWDPYVSLYANRGFLQGNIDFSDKGHSGWVGGWADWRRSATDLRELDVVGGKYAGPAKGTVFPVKPQLGNVRVTVSGGSLAAPVSQLMNLSVLNLVTVSGSNPYKLSLSIDRLGGSFTGSILLPGSTVASQFLGVLLQGEGRGAGVFVPAGKAGTLEAGSLSFDRVP